MKNINRYFLIAQIFIFILGFNQAYGESRNTTPQAKQILKVGVLPTPPYSYFKQGKPTGIAFDIWAIIARDNGWDCQYVNLGSNIDEAISKVHGGELDVLVGQIVHYSETEQEGFLSLTYLHSNYVLLAKKVQVNFRTRLHNTFKVIPLRMFYIFLLVYMIYMILFYAFEYKKQPELVGLDHKRAFEHILWRSLLSGMRKPPLYPTTRFIRLMTLVWEALITVITFSLIAGLTSTFFTGWTSTGEKLVHLSDLNDQFVDVLGGQALATSATNLGLNVDIIQPDITSAVEHLDHGKVAAIYMPHIVAATYIRSHAQDDLYISSIKFPSYNLGYLLSETNEHLLRDVNYALLKLTENGKKMLLCKKYLGYSLSEQVCF